MPNWCENTFKVVGEQDDVRKFDKAFKGFPALWDGELEEKRYSLNALFPVPKEVLEVGYSASRTPQEKFKAISAQKEWVDGYTWCINNWGTKWDISRVRVSRIPLRGLLIVEYHFLTAWSPPIEWVNKIAKDWPTIEMELSFFEPGMGFSGILSAKGDASELIENDYFEFEEGD